MISFRQTAQRLPEVAVDAMRVRLLPNDISLVARVWQEIESRVGTSGLACSWGWTETWLRHYGDLIPHRFVIGERQGPAAIALLCGGVCKNRGPFPIRTLHLGTSGEPEADTVRVQYNRVLVDEADRDAFLRGIARLAPQIDLKWEEFHLDGFTGAEIAPLLGHDRSFAAEHHVCYLADLDAIRHDGGVVLAALRTEPAKKIRRSIRRLEEAHGPIHVEWAESLDGARDIFENMRNLHQQRWEAVGEPGKFGSTRFDGFHREIVERLFPTGGIVLARVRAGDVTLGCDYSFVERNRILAYQWGLAQLEDKRLSPGLVTGAAVMQAAIERGYAEYDWLAGDILYKKQLSTTDAELIWAHAARGTRIQVIYKLAEARRLYRRLPFRQQNAVAS